MFAVLSVTSKDAGVINLWLESRYIAGRQYRYLCLGWNGFIVFRKEIVTMLGDYIDYADLLSHNDVRPLYRDLRKNEDRTG